MEIGHSFVTSKKLKEDHNAFTHGSNTIYANINRILGEAGQLIEAGHYASAHVRGVAARLDKTWKEFAGGLDERTTVLSLSALFHQKAEQVYNRSIHMSLTKSHEELGPFTIVTQVKRNLLAEL